MAIEIVQNLLVPNTRNVGDGVEQTGFRGERTGGLVVQPAHGHYYEAVSRGRVFIGQNAITGLAIPIYSAKANAMTLWNPAGSGYNLSVIAVYIGHYSTTNVAGNVAIAHVPTPGSAAGTGLPIITATLATPINALLGGGSASAALFSPAVNTVTANPTIVRTLGLSMLAATDASALTPFTMVDHIDGALVLGPNSAIQLVGVTAVAMVANQAIVWEEVPV